VRSAQAVSLARSGDAYVDPRKSPAAVLKVVEGPDQGQEYPLVSGSNVVGRGRSCEVRLTDLMVSRQHIRINVTDHAEVIDLGSANGVLVNDAATDRDILQPTDKVTIGDTTFTIRTLQSTATEGRIETTAVAFIRSPRLVSRFDGDKFEAPEIPEQPQRQRFPTLVLIAPILMGGIMYWVTQQALTLLFLALSPLMLLGSYYDQLVTGKSTYKRALKQWRTDVASLSDDLAAANQKEIASRLVEHPSVAECMTATRDLSNLLWTRRPDAPGFGEFRLGLGTQPARSVVELPDAKRASRAVFAELVEALAPHRAVADVPVVASPALQGGLGIAGPRSAAAAAAHGIVVQAAVLHSPEDLVIASVASVQSASEWEWLKWLPHTHSSSSPLDAHLASTTAGASTVLGSIEELIAARADSDSDSASHCGERCACGVRAPREPG
jgi:S-DNA-T family DNA segregation ATPase FtsK/SpoIIIE